MLLGLNGSPKTYVLCEVSHPEIPILDDVTPFEPISWLLHYDDLESLKRLSFRLDTRDKARLPTVSGIGISFQSGGLGRETRYIGPEELGGFDEDKVEDGISVVHFDIDAHKGERIVSVGVDSADNPRRIMVSEPIYIFSRLFLTRNTAEKKSRAPTYHWITPGKRWNRHRRLTRPRLGCKIGNWRRSHRWHCSISLHHCI